MGLSYRHWGLIPRRNRRMIAGGYTAKIIGSAPLVYYPMNETAGLTAVNYGSLGAAANGTYTGVTLNNAIGPDGVNGAPFFDGANDFLDFYTAAFDAAFNGATGTAMVWARVANVGVWTDGVVRRVINIYDDADNSYGFLKRDVNNAWQHFGEAGAGSATINTAALSSVDWVCYAHTWSDGANTDEYKAFIAGAQTGATSAALNNWNGGGLLATRVVFGATDNIVPSTPWHGWLAHGSVWDRVLTPSEILGLANP